ncbi:glycosyltransferase [Belliella sp. DSM 111904]|uniref:Glycosyltransferase n=1 Tax=Belliella filtrata TaxID=2923435 RepID=A0ABS9UY53_9BACT|nr:glycosyltransferase [Belliella filtrata]MCH7408655.1 glycosyltransferase [Belliella filtrata]
MKILQLIQKPQRRGAEIFAAQLAQELENRGHQVILVSIFEGKADLPFDGQQVHLDRPISRRFYDWKGWQSFAKLIKTFKPDLIQANAADTLKFAVFSKLIFRWNIPIVYRNANQMGDFITNSWHQKFNQFLLSRTATVIAVSKASQVDFLRKFQYPPSLTTVIPIGIDSKAINSRLAEPHDLKVERPYLIQIGGLVPEKDPMAMVEIFHALKEPQLKLLFLGTGKLKQPLLSQVNDLGLSDCVQFIPSQNNIFPWLQHAAALVMPSKIEGLPGVILEAMYCKVPVIAYGVGGIAEVLINDQTGWCVPSGDRISFLRAVKDVLHKDPASKEKILSQAKFLVEEKYALENIVAEFEQCYSAIILEQDD